MVRIFRLQFNNKILNKFETKVFEKKRNVTSDPTGQITGIASCSSMTEILINPSNEWKVHSLQGRIQGGPGGPGPP